MSTARNVGLGLGGLAVVIAALSSGRRTERPSMGRKPVAIDLDRYVRQDCTCGTIYQVRRGDLVLGRGPKSITWRVLHAAAELQAIPNPERVADDSSARVQYAAMICAAPFNQAALCDDPGRGYRRPGDGRGLDMRSKPAIYLPVLDFEALEAGIVAPSAWETGESTLTLPPEIREFFE